MFNFCFFELLLEEYSNKDSSVLMADKTIIEHCTFVTHAFRNFHVKSEWKDTSLNLKIFSLLLVVICEADNLSTMFERPLHVRTKNVNVSRLLLELSAVNVLRLLLELSAITVRSV